MNRFDETNTQASRLAAEVGDRRAPRQAQLRRKLHRWPGAVGHIAVAVVQSECHTEDMGYLTTGNDDLTPIPLTWIQLSGWHEDPPESGHFRLVQEAKRGRLRGVRVKSWKRREDHPYRHHELPVLLDCPTCGTPNVLARETLRLPDGLSQMWRGPLPP